MFAPPAPGDLTHAVATAPSSWVATGAASHRMSRPPSVSLMNDTTRRFLSAITERVPEGGRIVELRLFPAIRQGGIESGVAVVAVEPPAEAPASIAAEGEGDVDGSDAAVATLEQDGDAESIAVELDGDDEGRDDGDDEASTLAHGERVVPHVQDGVADDPASAAALALVDTDVIPEMEEGSTGEEIEGSATYIPSADTSDDESVEDALDDEMTRIVVDAEREVQRVASRQASDAVHPEVEADDNTEEAGDADEVEDSSVDATTEAMQPRQADASDAHDGSANADEDSPYADAPPPPEAPRRELLADVADSAKHDEDPDVMRLDDILALPSPDNTDAADEAAEPAEMAPAPRAIQRYAILTASYRLTIKGPDRGKWDVDMIHEADAPLATVERVARGVAKRSGDGSEPEHFSGESLKQALDAPAWIETT